MAWTQLPVAASASVLRAAFDEVRAAIVERCGATNTPTAGLLSSTGDGDQPRTLLTNYRTFVETLIPKFGNPTHATYVYAPYTKATCLTAAIGAANWVTNPDAVPQKMYIREINELRSVLNLLLWVNATLDAGATTGRASRTSDAQVTWALAKSAYAAAGWGLPSAFIGGFHLYAMGPGWANYRISNYRTGGYGYSMQPGTILAAKLAFVITGYDQGPPPGIALPTLDVFPEANFVGAPVNTSMDTANLWRAIDMPVPTPPSATYSFRLNPAEPNWADFDPFVPGFYRERSLLSYVTAFGPAPFASLRYQFTYE